jgi:hypothetical protein
MLHGIAAESRLDDLIDFLGDEYGVAPDRAINDTCSFIAELDRQQLISTDQSYLQEVVARLRRMYERAAFFIGFGMPPTPARYPRRRYPASPRYIVQACLESQTAAFGAAVVISAALFMLITIRDVKLGIPVLDFSADWPLAALACYLYGLAASSTVHEFGHYLVAGWLRIPVWSIFSRFGRAGITFGRNSARGPALLAVFLAGPLAVWLTMTLVVFGIWFLAPFTSFIRFLLCLLPTAIAATHLYSLLPFSSDGREIVRIIRGSRRRHGVSDRRP